MPLILSVHLYNFVLVNWDSSVVAYNLKPDTFTFTFRYSNSLKSLNNRYMHLTNYSINKKNQEYQNNSDENICQGHKW